jgi:hypothetical protein
MVAPGNTAPPVVESNGGPEPQNQAVRPPLLSYLRMVAETGLRLIGLAIKSFTHDIWVSRSLPDARQRLWDTRLKILAVLGILASAWWAVHSYNTTAERELRKTFWEKQISLYFEITDAASNIATLPPGHPAREQAVARFWQLYFGSLRVVEDDKNVGNAMHSFGLCLPQPGRHLPEQNCDQAILLQKSLNLAVRCRLSISENWNRKLEGLKGL